jgi:hypothetical protein
MKPTCKDCLHYSGISEGVYVVKCDYWGKSSNYLICSNFTGDSLDCILGLYEGQVDRE